MSDHDQLARRLAELARKAEALQTRARQLSESDDDTLWMSSLDIIDQLLNTITGLMQSQEVTDMLPVVQLDMHCPHCHHRITLPPDAALATAATCPVCGVNIVLANPT